MTKKDNGNYLFGGLLPLYFMGKLCLIYGLGHTATINREYSTDTKKILGPRIITVSSLRTAIRSRLKLTM
ncbi:MAG TPA: hypothetical protein DDW65_10635 [Firmicutes bacterium]|jgi:hypothetical protein|nr:hypothetical protein [Bacillota bacterium]